MRKKVECICLILKIPHKKFVFFEMSDEDYPNYPKAYGVGETKLGPWVGFGRPGGGFGVEVLSEMRQNRSSVGGENDIIGNVIG